MKYVMKQKLFSLTDSYVIRDEYGRDLYQVVGKLFSLSNMLSFRDMAGNEFAVIRRRIAAWSPTYDIFYQNQIVATIKKHVFSLFAARFTIESAAYAGIEVNGNFFDYEYAFTHGGREIARVSKQFFNWSDTYGIEVVDEASQGIILAAAVVIDLCCHERD